MIERKINLTNCRTMSVAQNLIYYKSSMQNNTSISLALYRTLFAL